MVVEPGSEIAAEIMSMPLMSGQSLPASGRVSLAPCYPRATLASENAPWSKAGRPCPFVALSDDNSAAADVVLYSLTEHTRGLAEQYAEAISSEMEPHERGPFYDRVIAALRSGPVMQKLYPEPETTNA